MMRVSVLVMYCMLLSACEWEPMLPESSAWSSDVGYACRKELGGKSQRIGQMGQCGPLMRCVSNRGSSDPVLGNVKWSLYQKINPDPPPGTYPVAHPMSYYRANAKNAGPKAMELFTAMERVRNECLIETGLRDLIPDE